MQNIQFEERAWCAGRSREQGTDVPHETKRSSIHPDSARCVTPFAVFRIASGERPQLSYCFEEAA